jgi:hypothetical protein
MKLLKDLSKYLEKRIQLILSSFNSVLSVRV